MQFAPIGDLSPSSTKSRIPLPDKHFRLGNAPLAQGLRIQGTMKLLSSLFAAALLTLTGCVTVHRDEPETTTHSSTTVTPAASATVSQTTTY